MPAAWCSRCSDGRQDRDRRGGEGARRVGKHGERDGCRRQEGGRGGIHRIVSWHASEREIGAGTRRIEVAVGEGGDHRADALDRRPGLRRGAAAAGAARARSTSAETRRPAAGGLRARRGDRRRRRLARRHPRSWPERRDSRDAAGRCGLRRNRGKGAAVRGASSLRASDVGARQRRRPVRPTRRAGRPRLGAPRGRRRRARVARASRLVDRRRQPRSRETMGKAFNAALRLLTGLPFRDTQCGFKLLRLRPCPPRRGGATDRGVRLRRRALCAARAARGSTSWRCPSSGRTIRTRTWRRARRRRGWPSTCCGSRGGAASA